MAALFGALSSMLLPHAGANGVGAAAVGTGSAATGSWGVVATQSTATPPPDGALTLTATSNEALFFQAVNVGTVSLQAMTWSVTVVGVGTTVSLEACTQPWKQTGNSKCMATETAIGTWSAAVPVPSGDLASGASVSSPAVPADPTATLYLQATVSSAPVLGAQITITTAVSSGSASQLRAATVTNS